MALESKSETPSGELAPLPPGDADPDDDSSAGRMSFLDHLDELRKRLVRTVLGILAGFLIAFGFIKYIFEFIMVPLQQVLPEGGKLIYTEPGEAFFLYMKIAALAGLVLATPYTLTQVWLFISPGLFHREKRFAIPFVVFSTMFFIVGALFSHYAVFPLAWKFFAGFSTDYMEFLPKIGPVFSLYVKMLLAMGIVFQLPTLIFFLARLGLVTPKFLIKNTKYAILIIFIIAAIITPSADPVTQTAMAVPMIMLYGLSILIAHVFRKRSLDDESTK